jgi:3-oxoacyl-[acyl-carrier-protein] synthase II
MTRELGVVITGLGPITASGVGRENFWAALHSDRSPVRTITRFDASPFRSQVAAEVTGFEPSDHLSATRARRLNRFTQFAVSATRLALDDAELAPETVIPERAAVLMGSALGGISQAADEMVKYIGGGLKQVNPRLALGVFGGAASCEVAIEFDFRGPNSTNSMSCASGSIALGEAWRLIRDGVVDVAVAGGVEAPLSPLSFGAFAIIRAMSTRNDDPSGACRPFDRDRDGFVMGEAACVLVLESEAHAIRRGAHVYARLLGFGTSNDAHHMTAPRPDGSQAARAIEEALSAAGVAPEEIDHVNAHGSSTPLNDSTESLAISRALGTKALEVPVTGTKPFYGHALGASGAIEAAIAALTIRDGWIPPTLNLEHPGEGCDLNYIMGSGLDTPVSRMISNSFGFGGINASLVFGSS